MESSFLLRARPFAGIHSSFPLPSRPRLPFITPSALKSPRGFGTAKTLKQQKQKEEKKKKLSDNDDEEEDEEGDVAIPEVVTNRMMRRMGLSVGIPLTVGLLFFPFFYYLKVVAKVDVPNWVPFIFSFAFFGTALLGVSYGIVSASWDPLREGSLLGWNEARRNWPVFWESLWGRRNK
ncbi:protein PAM68, chloroplastic [Iris pallida]|uniref:Protein PAM68, chloroplastic n=1 Tax=Iris pallida TaxID=29817 RepID=A0AAX6DFC5_IRIPA|nr:protein PAM68, chloroplastic [Iris pallida]